MRKPGFDYEFDSSKCQNCKGKCCTGESGFIWITKEEAQNLAQFLKLDFDYFCQNFLIKYGYRFSIKEKKFQDGFACVFFDEAKFQCLVYPFRPNQCKTFPFWDYFKENFNELKMECCGVSKIRKNNDT